MRQLGCIDIRYLQSTRYFHTKNMAIGDDGKASQMRRRFSELYRRSFLASQRTSSLKRTNMSEGKSERHGVKPMRGERNPEENAKARLAKRLVTVKRPFAGPSAPGEPRKLLSEQ